MKIIGIISLILMFLSSSQAQWVSNYSGNSQGDLNIVNAKGLAVDVDNSGKCYVTGYICNQTTGIDIVVIKYNNGGDTIWTRTYSGNGYNEDKAWGIIVDEDNNVYITGTITVPGRGFEVAVLKYNQNGVLKWVKTWGATSGNRDDMGHSIALNQNEQHVYITGYCTNADGKKDLILQKYATSNGTLKYTKKQDGAENMDSEGFGIAIDNDNRIFVTGYTSAASQMKNMITLRFNQAGTMQWQRVYNGPVNNNDEAWGIAVDDENNAYVTGYITAANNTDNTNAIVLKYNAAGSLQWNRTHNGSGGASTDKAWGIIVDDATGMIYITGQTAVSSNELDYLTIKYTETGVKKWTSTYNGPGDGDDIANAIALMNNGNPVVTGESWGNNENFDYATLKINKNNGNVNDVMRYSMTGSTNDKAKDVAVSPQGVGNNIYVTGYSELIVESNTESCAISTIMMLGERNEDVSNTTPTQFTLHQNYPNPFNPSTTIKFDVSNTSFVKLVVYDMLGRIVDVLVDRNLDAGSYNITYTNKNLASGIYFYELSSGDFKDIKKMTLVK